MRKNVIAMKPFLHEILHDAMLIACIIGPVCMGILFKIGVPALEKLLMSFFQNQRIIEPYYCIFDMILTCMTPVLFCFSGVLVTLEEIDAGIAKYYYVTPVGKKGYLFSRIGIPTILSLFYNIIILAIFHLSEKPVWIMLSLCVCGGLIAVITSLLVIAFAKNKMEGMALVKMSGLFILGIPAACFMVHPIKYVFAFLPSFWIAQICTTQNAFLLFPMIVSSIILCYILGKKIV